MPRGPAPSDVVTCPACGTDVERTATREYDRFGDRWNRDGKTFEYLCKPCYRSTCRRPRDGLEESLVAVGTHDSVEAFLAAYYAEVANGRRAR